MEPESENDVKRCTNSYFGNIGKRKKGIIEIYSSIENEANVSDDFTKKMSRNKSDNTYIQKLGKIKRNAGKNITLKMEKFLKS